MDGSQVAQGESSRNQQIQLLALESKVKRWKWCVGGCALILVGIYTYYFRVRLGQDASTEASTWGAFGDFVGGLMNPVVAFAAFFWLTESVMIQKTELVNTRNELSNATAAQHLAVENGRKSVELAVLSALVSSNNSRLELLNLRIKGIDEAITRADGFPSQTAVVESAIKERNVAIRQAVELEAQLSELDLNLQAMYNRILATQPNDMPPPV